MGRNLNQMIGELAPERQARVEACYQALKQEVESLRKPQHINGEAKPVSPQK